MIRIIDGTKKATPVPQRQEANPRQEAVAAPSSLSQSVPVAGGQAAPRRRRSTPRNPEGRSPRQSIATRTGRSSPHSSSTGAGIDRYGSLRHEAAYSDFDTLCQLRLILCVHPELADGTSDFTLGQRAKGGQPQFSLDSIVLAYNN